MQFSVQIKPDDIINAVKKMSLNDLEELKSAIIKREIYFKKFKKDEIKNIITDFLKEGYSENFLSDLENGLKKSSVYNANKKAKR
jgi:Cdc6-like AAA superfamily ATPase